MNRDDTPTYDRRSDAEAALKEQERKTRYLHQIVETPDGRYRVEPVRAEGGSR